MRIDVCIDCTTRRTACHDSCPKYLKQRAELNKENEIKRMYQEANQRSPRGRNRNSMWKTSKY